MKYKLHFFLILFFIGNFLLAQTDSVFVGKKPATKNNTNSKKNKNSEWVKKITYGGNFQLQLGNISFIYLSPTIGYKLSEKINLGIGAIYNYSSYRTSLFNFGIHSYARFFVKQNVFLQIQYDKLNQPDYFSSYSNKTVWVDYLLLGLGYTQPISDYIALNSLCMYNLSPNLLSLYPSRLIIQFGITANF